MGEIISFWEGSQSIRDLMSSEWLLYRLVLLGVLIENVLLYICYIPLRKNRSAGKAIKYLKSIWKFATCKSAIYLLLIGINSVSKVSAGPYAIARLIDIYFVVTVITMAVGVSILMRRNKLDLVSDKRNPTHPSEES